MLANSALLLNPPSNWFPIVDTLVPGAHLLLFSDVKNHHVNTVAAEDAGLEVRDTIAWVFSDGGNDVGLKLVTVARKPLDGTVAENVIRWGTGGLNIDKCRVEYVTVEGGNLALNPHLRSHINGGNGGHIISTETKRRVVNPHSEGRWPANLLHCGSDWVLRLFPANAGASAPVKGTEASMASVGNVTGKRGRVPGVFHSDTGSAARFFYAAPSINDLIAYLLKLVTPPGGTVLVDKGTTAEKVAEDLGFTLALLRG